MQLTNLLKKPKLLLISLLVLTSSCAQVPIKNNTFCGDLGNHGARCNKTQTSDPKDLTKAQWDKVRFGWICTSAEGFENWKTAIESLCDKTGMCSFEDQQSLEVFFEQVRQFNLRAKTLKPKRTSP